jgi:putative membrane-bound dehydrogenase-like protein
MMLRLSGLLCLLPIVSLVRAQDFQLQMFHRQQLSDVYYSEGVATGDLNSDGTTDIVYGPHWYAGPTYTTQQEIYPAVPQKREGYADSFFNWVHDFDKDGWNDILAVGFPGTPAFVYRNPGKNGLTGLWEKHQVAESVSNESPQFTDITGDGVPELVCTQKGHYGFYVPDTTSPLATWEFVSISEAVAPTPFGHGLGVGDVNSDGRMDVIATDGWMEQPAAGPVEGYWKFHTYPFAHAGADMFAYDVDGDDDADIITALSAHEFGLAWYENTGIDGSGEIQYEQHLVMGTTREDSPYGVLFTELHAVKMADMNGDGLQDIVTGKTWWSHHTQSPMWDAGAVVYWFELSRSDDGTVEYIPHLANGETGIGRGLVVDDINKDGLVDIVCGGMKGANVLIHVPKYVTAEEYRLAQPQKRRGMAEGLSPAAAAMHMTVPPGFKVQLAAGEPMVHQPVAMCFDHRGRLWVAEAHTYPLRASAGEGKDKILIFEDTTGDGVFDTSTTFIESLNLVSGLEVGFGGVFVGAAPYLMFIPDRDGDDVPDGVTSEPGGVSPRGQQLSVQFPDDVPPGAIVLRDGFGWQDTHETLNTFIWGPDGWLYGCHGVFTHSRVGRPGAADEDRLPLNASVWRYHPQKDIFEAFMNGTSNPWGVDFNDKGQAFLTACVIPHLWHVIQGGRYHRQGGQHFNAYTYEDIQTIADHAHYVGNIADHAWWGHEPKAAGATADAGGGHAHCGAMIYLGDNWPDEYRNKIYFNNVHGNRINCDVLESEAGSGFVGHHGQDLLLANDHYFRGINLRYGPDGSVYLIDWYDKNACHRTNPEIWDRSNGRIFRISYGDIKESTFDRSNWTEDQLLAAHEQKNDWYARTARRLLMEQDCSLQMKASLWKSASDTTKTVERRLRYLWSLHVVGGLTQQSVDALLHDKEEYLRAWTVQLALENQTPSDQILKQLQNLATNDTSAVVRLYITSALQRISVEKRWEIASALAMHGEDAEDHNLPLLLWYGVEPLVAVDPQRAIELALSSKIPMLRRFIFRRAAAQNDSLPAAVAVLGSVPDIDLQRLIMEEIMASFEGRVGIPMPDAWKAAYEALMASDQQDVRDRADQIAVLFGDQRVFGPMRALLADPQQNIARRRQALEVLVKGQDKSTAEVLLSDAVINNPDLQSAAIKGLSALRHDRTPAVLLARYSRFGNDARADAISTIISRPEWAKQMLTAIADGTVPSGDLHAYHVRQILSFHDEELNELLKSHWGEIRETAADRKKQVARWKKELTPRSLSKANLGNGRRIFLKTCQNCHRLFGNGGQIGPDITGSNRANLDYILENILDPSAVVGRDYQMTVVALKDGRVVSGLLKQESDSALTIQTINDKVVVPIAEIEDRSLSSVSMMPERQLEPMTSDEVRDLIAYLGSPAQVVLAGPSAPIDADTGKVPSAIEGESMAIVDKSGGSVSSQSMSSFKADRWSGADHLWWTGGKPGDTLALEVIADKELFYDVEIVLTRARDYGIVKLLLDDIVLDAGLDLYNGPAVITTGVLTYPGIPLSAGKHQLKLEITGANPDAVKSYMVGMDYLRLVPSAK